MDNRYAAWVARWRVPLGFALGAVYLIFCQPTPILLVSGGAVALTGLGLRAFAAGYLEKRTTLAMGGPFRYTRNPLYFGSFIMGLGFALTGGSLLLGLSFLGFFAIVYWPVMRREERQLRLHFGETYDRYAERVPAFFPAWRADGTPDSQFRWSRYRNNYEYRAALGYVAAVLILALKSRLR
jgi:protein-S-isoprenylcysteine O-methyltransferase Ste14